MGYDDLPPPFVLGLPERYDQWRTGQAEAVSKIENSTKRFVLCAAPTGFGKSLTYIAAALALGVRTAIVTSTKGLQEQLMRDFRSTGLVDIRGMNAYPCVAAPQLGMPKTTNCAEAPCHAGYRCPIRSAGCAYYDAFNVASNPDAQLVVTNYAYWMHIHRHGEGLGDFGLLILDEAHDAPDCVVDFIGVTLDTTEIGSLLDDARTPSEWDPASVWASWVAERTEQVKMLFDAIQEHEAAQPVPDQRRVRKALRLKTLAKKLEAAANIDPSWIIEQQGRVFRLDPVWPARYAERALFRGIDRVAMFSATLRPKIANLLGVANDKIDFQEFASSFPCARRPVYHIPTVAVRYDSNDKELEQWVNRADQIIGQRLDRKGIIHSVSYSRRDLLVHNSAHRNIMLHHSRENTADVVAKFKRMRPPAVLVSPSLSTGWDFPYKDCEYQIIAKVPFPDFTSAIAKARDAQDTEWSKYLTMMAIVQMSGRPMRAEDDQCETLIIDDNIEWFVRRYKHYAPRWWLEAFKLLRTIPQPLALL